MKTVLVTGASRGIGREITKKFAQNGYNVVINYNKSEKDAKTLAQELQQYNVVTMLAKADVSNEKDVQKMVNNAIKMFGNIDVLVNNAGISLSKLLQDCSSKEIGQVLNTNTLGSIYTTKAVVPNMVSNKSGKIINISSIWGEVGASMEAVYSASKGAVISFTKAMAKELAPSGINVNCICPGVIDTDMMKEYNEQDKQALIDATPLNRIGSASDIANMTYFLASEEASFVTGQIISIDGGFSL